MEELIKEIKERIAELEPSEEQLERDMEEFDPSDWSGGNFDDCYFIGEKDGALAGELKALRVVLERLEELE